MAINPQNTVFSDGTPMAKSAMRALFRDRVLVVLATPAEMNALVTEAATGYYIVSKAAAYLIVPGGVAVDDGDVNLVSSDGYRYRKVQPFNWEPAGWAVGTQFHKGDALTHNGTSYIAIADNIAFQPGVTAGWTSYWQVLASKGADGVSLNPRGAWVTATAYAINDLVENDGSQYIAIASNASIEPGITAGWPASWGVFAAAGATGTVYTHRGNWGAAVSYAVNDIAVRNGSSWLAVTASINLDPSVDSGANWRLFAAKGDNGTGTGNVNGPATTTATRLAFFNNTAGTLLGEAAATWNAIDQSIDTPTLRATGTGALRVPAGTTAQRPVTGVDGDTRWNTTLQTFEVYGSGAWRPLAPTVGGNLLINGDFQINQRAYAGAALLANAYGRDRWKADVGGATYNVSGFIVTQSVGTIVQVVEPTVFGRASLASTTVTFSVDTPSAALTITVGTQSGVIAAGTGRMSLTLALTAGDTGNVAVKIGVAASTTYGRVKLEVGGIATDWVACQLTHEMALCERYFTRRRVDVRGRGAAAAAVIYGDANFAVAMRAAPTATLISAATSLVNSGAVAVSAATFQHSRGGSVQATATAIGAMQALGAVVDFNAEL